jgi:lysyl-tRNA synthetase class 2
VAKDQRLIAALKKGLPSCSGIALGIDRLLMLRAGVDDIAEVLSFGFDRA